MKKITLVFVLVAVLAAGMLGYLFYKQRQVIGPQNNQASLEPDNIPAPENTTSWNDISSLGFPLLPQNESEMYGGVEIKVEGEKTRVIVNLTGDYDSTGSYIANIHTGSCPITGDIKYNLAPIADGISTTVLEKPVSQIAQDIPLAVTIQTQGGSPVACGDFIVQ